MFGSLFLVILFLNIVSGDDNGKGPFDCVQPFGTMPDEGFSVIQTVSLTYLFLYLKVLIHSRFLQNRTGRHVQLNVYWSNRMVPVVLDLTTRSIDSFSDHTIWPPIDQVEFYSQFKAILNSHNPDTIRILLNSDKFYEFDGSKTPKTTKDITDQLNTLLPITSNVTSWSTHGHYQLVVYSNNIRCWIYDNPSAKRTYVQTEVFSGLNCKVAILDIEGEGTNAIVKTLIAYGNLWTLRKMNFGDPILAWRDTQWMTTREFLGCPRSICFDGLIDDAHTFGQDLFIFIGRHVVIVSSDLSKSDPIVNSVLNKNTGYITAATDFVGIEDGVQSSMYITSAGSLLIDGQLYEGRIQDWFPDIESSDTIDAAFSVGDQLTMIVGNQSTTRLINIINDKVTF